MHRNTLLLVAFLAVIAALLVGLNVGRSLSPSQTPKPSPAPTPIPTIGYLSGTVCGVSFMYSNSLQEIESSTSGTILADATNPNNSIVIACQKDIPRVPLAPDKIETIEIGSFSAKLYHDASPKDGTPIDKLIFTHPKTKLDVFIAGFGTTYQALLQSLQLQ